VSLLGCWPASVRPVLATPVLHQPKANLFFKYSRAESNRIGSAVLQRWNQPVAVAGGIPRTLRLSV